ncbi:MAG: hypothetical protein M3R48_02050 [Candidatus Dormibacteraeota bacterium]|nr:hypothetical protein [Candidatus Dormibacteraeota bacterium]
MTPMEAWRTWSRQRELRRWTAGNAYPPTVQRTYRTTPEFEKDAARLKACGYTAVVEEASDSSVDVSPQPSVYGRGQAARLIVDVPMFHVTYERR